jgi:hypothetical protein
MPDTENEELIAAAEFIQSEMRTGFLHPGVVALGSRAREALTALVAAALASRPPVPVTPPDYAELDAMPHTQTERDALNEWKAKVARFPNAGGFQWRDAVNFLAGVRVGGPATPALPVPDEGGNGS